MYKHIMFYLMVMVSLVKVFTIPILIISEQTDLPIIILALQSMVAIGAMVLIAKAYIKGIRLKELIIFYIIETVVIVFSLMIVAFATPVNIDFYESLVTGSVLDIVINVILLLLAVKTKKLEEKMDENND